MVLRTIYMSENLFIPKAYRAEQIESTPAVTGSVVDKIGSMIINSARYLVAVLIFLLPLFFVPGLPASLGFDKVLITVTLGLTTLILISLAALRFSKTSTVLPLPLLLFWIFVVLAFLGGLLTGDIQDALRGSVFEPQTAGFFAVMGLAMTLPLILQQSKLMSLRTLVFFTSASALIVGYTLLRLIFSTDILSLGSFSSITLSPVGGFNDLAIFAALTIILALITLLQLPLRKGIQLAISALIIGSIIILAIVNFFHLWLVVGFFGLLLLVYILSRDTFLYHSDKTVKSVVSPVLIGITMFVRVMSILFVIAGEYMGAKISEVTDISYVEVRPSVTATIDVARKVFKEDVLLGVGPNRFADAWRLHKDPSINQTIFWNTDFTAGFGFVPTIFVTMGLLGGVLMVSFHATYLYLGYRMLIRNTVSDSFWTYFGIITFTASVFLWGITYVYVPGSTILLLAALFTGLSFVSYGALVPAATVAVPLVSSRQRGLLVMVVTIIVIIACVSTLFTVGKQYVAQSEFTNARLNSTTPEEFEVAVSNAFSQYSDDAFVTALAQIKLAELQNLLTITEPTKEDEERFVQTAGVAMNYANQAILKDDSNPQPHATLADILIVLSQAGISDASQRASGKIADAQYRNPLNPSYALMTAYMAVRSQDLTKAREEIAKSLALKPNYSEALFLLTQIDISEGKLESAIETTRQIITLEPNNPTRYYQLGVLLAANKNYDESIAAYQTAVTQDANFANARYMMAMAYLDSGRLEEALAQLRIVRETNQDNQQLIDLITQLETGGIPTIQDRGLENQINGVSPEQNADDSVASPVDPDTDLVTPVNTIGETSSQSNASAIDGPAQ